MKIENVDLLEDACKIKPSEACIPHGKVSEYKRLSDENGEGSKLPFLLGDSQMVWLNGSTKVHPRRRCPLRNVEPGCGFLLDSGTEYVRVEIPDSLLHDVTLPNAFKQHGFGMAVCNGRIHSFNLDRLVIPVAINAVVHR